MKARNILRVCLAMEWVCGITAIVLSVVLDDRLPAPLRSWLKEQSKARWDLSEVLFLVIFLFLLVLAIVGTVGLFLLQRWAAWVYLAASVLGVVGAFCARPTVEHAMASGFGEAASVLSGMVIALAFFSDALDREPAGRRVVTVRAVPARSDAP